MTNSNSFQFNNVLLKGLARMISTGLIAAVLMSCMSGISSAEGGLTEYTRLADLVLPGRPVRASVDASGNIYVVEAATSYLAKYSPQGEVLTSLPLSSAPTAVKVADDGLLYIGLKDKIEIYDGTTLRKTVQGIAQPVAIEVSSTGSIYAVDLKRYCVTIISPGGDIAVVGDHNSFGSDLRDLVLDEANQEFYLLDRNEPVSGSSVWRVQVFDLNGSLLRSFSHFGSATDGTLISASSLAVDAQRRVYIADNVQNIIGVFDHAGNYLGSLYDTADPYYNPVEMEYRNNRLYLMSFLGNKVTVLGFDGYADLVVLPDRLDLKVQGPFVSGERRMTLSSTGRGTLNWSAASDPDWLGLSKTAGSIGGGLEDEAEVAVNTTGLGPGTHTGKITFSFNGGSSTVSVTVDVLPPPVLSVSPARMAFDTYSGTMLSRQATIELNNDLSGALAWTAVSDSRWLGISPASGESNTMTTALVTVDAAGLLPGTYRGKISVAADGNSVIPAEVSVELTVLANNTIRVKTNKGNAVFSISGPQSFQGSGSSWSVSNVADGSYTITYAEVRGARTPGPETQTVAGGSTIIFTGNYNDIAHESIIVTQAGRMDTTGLKLIDIYGNVREFAAFGLMRGGLVTALGDLDGDGLNEIAAAIHHGSSRVGIFDQSGREIFKFAAFTGSGTYDISAADLSADGSSELIISKSSGTPVVRVLSFSKGMVADTGIHFIPYGEAKGADLLVAAGDVDGDGKTDIVTALASDSAILIKVWSPDMSEVHGKWTVSLKKEISVDLAPRASLKGLAVNPAAGNRAADVMVMRNDGHMTIVGADGPAREVSVGVEGITDMEAGDVDGDGNVEIITGLTDGTVKIFSLDGILVNSMRTFITRSGVRVSVGVAGGVVR
ncbi:MAG: hypothetical protein EPN25_06595 [Nitrospirae bacterium]|nr:MAG: hypothetical protein EPN25_06595 [Nitrospirota bacterium]